MVTVLRNRKLHLIITTQKVKIQIFAEMGLGQAEQHLLWPPVYTLFFVCLALVVNTWFYLSCSYLY
jgi:hypothetical protein